MLPSAGECFWEKRRQVFRNGRLQMEPLSGERVMERQTVGVKSHAARKGLSAIECISGQWTAYRGHVEPNLMGPPGVEPETQKKAVF